MKMNLISIILIATALTMGGCNGNKPTPPDPGKETGELAFTATFADASTQGFKNTWSEGDKIAVYAIKGNSTTQETLSATAITGGGRSATFKSSGALDPEAETYLAFIQGTGITGPKMGKYWAVESMNSFGGTLPSVTVAQANGKSRTLTFSNLYALLTFSVDDPKVKYVEVKGNSDEILDRENYIAFDGFSIEEHTSSPAFKPSTVLKKNVNGTGEYVLGLFPGIELPLGYSITAYNAAGEELAKGVSYDALSVKGGAAYTAVAFGEGTVDKNDIFDENKIMLSLALITDTHISNGYNSDNKLKSALNQLKNKAAVNDPDGLDAVLVSGDLTDNPNNISAQAGTFKSLYESVFSPKDVPMFYTVGNHESPGYSWNANTVTNAKKMADALGSDYFTIDLDNDMRTTYEARHAKIGEYHVIGVTPCGSSPVVYRSEVISWLDNLLAEITTENPDQFIILITHPLIDQTVYGSLLGSPNAIGDEWYSSVGYYWSTASLTGILDKYPQVVTFGGHLHFPLNDPRSIWQGSFTAVGSASVSYMAIENGKYENMKSATVMNDAGEYSQGNLVQFDLSGNMRITRMDFYHNAVIGEPWEITHPKSDRSHLFKYSHTALRNANTAPTLSRMEVKLSKLGSATMATVDFDAGEDDEFVHHYVLTLKKGGNVVMTKKVLADFYRNPKASDMKKEWAVALGSLPAGEYEASLIAYDSWDLTSNTLTETFRVESSSSNKPEVYVDIDFDDGTITDAKDNVTVVNHGGRTVKTNVTFNGKSYSLYALNAGVNAFTEFRLKAIASSDDFKIFASGGFAIEALFVDREPGAGVNDIHGILCGTQQGGWGLAIRKTGVPYFIVGEDKYNNYVSVDATSAISATNLTHIMCVYDPIGGKMKIYINGKLNASETISGIFVPGSGNAFNGFCLGADISLNTESQPDYPCTDMVIVDAKIHTGVPSDTEVNAAYNASIAILK